MQDGSSHLNSPQPTSYPWHQRHQTHHQPFLSRLHLTGFFTVHYFCKLPRTKWKMRDRAETGRGQAGHRQTPRMPRLHFKGQHSHQPIRSCLLTDSGSQTERECAPKARTVPQVKNKNHHMCHLSPGTTMLFLIRGLIKKKKKNRIWIPKSMEAQPHSVSCTKKAFCHFSTFPRDNRLHFST